MLSYLLEFKLIFVRELVPFEKWYQEAIYIYKAIYYIYRDAGKGV